MQRWELTVSAKYKHMKYLIIVTALLFSCQRYECEIVTFYTNTQGEKVYDQFGCDCDKDVEFGNKGTTYVIFVKGNRVRTIHNVKKIDLIRTSEYGTPIIQN